MSWSDIRMPRRRQVLMWPVALATPLIGSLAGCGFELRRAPTLPFERVALSGFSARSPLAEELTRELAASAKVVAAGDRPEVLLQAITDRRDKVVVAATAAGQVREVQLRMRFEFRLQSAGGRELLAPVNLLLTRDLSYNETAALAKEYEEAQIYAALQTEIIMQVLRRLAVAKRA